MHSKIQGNVLLVFAETKRLERLLKALKVCLCLGYPTLLNCRENHRSKGPALLLSHFPPDKNQHPVKWKFPLLTYLTASGILSVTPNSRQVFAEVPI